VTTGHRRAYFAGAAVPAAFAASRRRGSHADRCDRFKLPVCLIVCGSVRSTMTKGTGSFGSSSVVRGRW
jgi:hypothetical protein